MEVIEGNKPAKVEFLDKISRAETSEEVRKIQEDFAFLSSNSDESSISPLHSSDIQLEGISYRKASEVTPTPIRWLWPGRIAKGKVSMLAGNPGLGKSQLTASIAATVSTGGIWAVDRTTIDPANVIFFSAEDDAEDTIRPRLEAAGANLDKVFIVDSAPILCMKKEGHHVQRSFSLEEDLPRLEKLLDEIKNVALVVIDPITAYLGGVDGNQNAEIRGLLAPLSSLAARHGTSIVCISHFNKTGSGDSLMRIMGSLAFVAAARAAYAVLADPDDPSRRLFLPIKNNIGDDKSGLAFRIEGSNVLSAAGKIETSRVVWESAAVTMTANEALAATDSIDRTATEEAIDWLSTILSDGPMKAGDVQKEAKQAGISDKALRRAREKLGIKPQKREFAGGWWWCLKPIEDAPIAEDAQDTYIQKQGSLDGEGHLGNHQATVPVVPLPINSAPKFNSPIVLDDLTSIKRAKPKKEVDLTVLRLKGGLRNV